MKIKVNENICIGCGTCASLCEECFEIKGGISHVKKDECDGCNLNDVASSCPVGAIEVTKEGTEEHQE